MRFVPALLAFLLLRAAASAASFEDLRFGAQAGFAGEAGFRPDMSAFKASYQEAHRQAQIGAAQRQALVPLPRILNNMRRTAVTFKAGGADVHVFGLKAQNNSGMSGWYVGFAVEGGETVFYRGYDALHLRKLGVGPDRKLRIVLNGRPFELQVKASMLRPMTSRVVITPLEPGVPPVEFTVAQLADGVFAAGWPVTLEGREYRVLYTENIVETGASGEDAAPGGRVRLSGDRAIALMFKDKGGVSAYGWLERNIPRDRPAVTWTVAKGADSDGDPGPALSAMIDAEGRLDLRWVAPAPAKR
jgi:hypothetical protein